jgi:hypothetical protein
MSYVSSNPQVLTSNSTILACIVEQYSAHINNEEYVNKTGHDSVTLSHKLIEIKYTNSLQRSKQLRIQNIVGKRGLFDYVRVIDGVNNRAFLVPHDTFFSKAKLSASGEFHWSGSYNTTDKVQIDNTTLLLQHEVK